MPSQHLRQAQKRVTAKPTGRSVLLKANTLSVEPLKTHFDMAQRSFRLSQHGMSIQTQSLAFTPNQRGHLPADWLIDQER
jgi:hypothetical protein